MTDATFSELQIISSTENSLRCKVGIKNLGNTCYMSSALQCLSNIPEFSFYFLNNTFSSLKSNPTKNKSVLITFSNLINKLHNGTEKVISIQKFRNAFGKRHKLFLENTQEDSQEFLLTLLDELHQDLNIYEPHNSLLSTCEESLTHEQNHNENNTINSKINNGEKELLTFFTKNKSIITDLFTGQFRSSVQCFKCKHISHSFDIFMSLSLPIPVNNEINIDIFFIFFDITKGILKIPISIENDLLVLDLRNKISVILNVHPMSFIICLMEGYTILKIINCLTQINDVVCSLGEGTRNEIFCFQLNTNLNIAENKFLYKNNTEKIIGDDNSFNNSTDNTIVPTYQFKRIHISDLNTEPIEIHYSEVDPCFLELYSSRDFNSKDTEYGRLAINYDNLLNNSMSSETSIREEAKKIIVDTIAHSLLQYCDENYGYNQNYIKVYIYFKESSEFPLSSFSSSTNNQTIEKEKTNNNNQNNTDNYSQLQNSYYYRRKEISYPRMVMLNKKWSLLYLKKYIYDNFSVVSARPEIRIVNPNKNKYGGACFICKDINCDNCLLSNIKGAVTIEDVINLYPINKNNQLKVDNNYLYYDFNQRKVCIPRHDFEIELTYQSNQTHNICKYLHLTKAIIPKQRKNSKEIKKEGIDIYDCLKKFAQKEILDESNLWFCDKCKSNQKAIKKIQINYFPEILVIHLKRFKGSAGFKINNQVDVPLYDFILKSYNIEEKYNLVGVINHYGNLVCGHYTAYCKNHYDGKWYKFDDSNETEIKEESVVTNEAYVLLFKKTSLNVEEAKKFYEVRNKCIDEIKKRFKSFLNNSQYNNNKNIQLKEEDNKKEESN